MRARSFVIPLLAAIVCVAALRAAPDRQAPRTVALAVGDNMKFDVERIDAAPGERLRVILSSVGKLPKIAMAHNFVLLAGGVDPVAFTKESVHAVPPDFLPPNSKRFILAATPLAGNGETVEVTFTVPVKPGRYDYICAYPGHFASGARGVLVVSKPQTEGHDGSI